MNPGQQLTRTERLGQVVVRPHQVLQFAILALGLAGFLYTAYRITNRRYLTPARRRATLIPITVLIVVLGALNVAMFLFPMGNRM